MTTAAFALAVLAIGAAILIGALVLALACDVREGIMGREEER